MNWSQIVTEYLAKDERYDKVLGFIRRHSTGKVWLVGGLIYRPLISALYGHVTLCKDLDFMTEERKSIVAVPTGWQSQQNSFGADKFHFAGSSVDFWTLAESRYLTLNNLEPTLQHYFDGVMFDIQAVAYDVDTKELVMDPRFERSLKTRTMSVVCRDNLEWYSKLKGKTPAQMLQEKADDLGFSVRKD